MKKFVLAFALGLGLLTQSNVKAAETTAPYVYGAKSLEALIAFKGAVQDNPSWLMRPLFLLKHFPGGAICGALGGTVYVMAIEKALSLTPEFQKLSVAQQKAIIWSLRVALLSGFAVFGAYTAKNYSVPNAFIATL